MFEGQRVLCITPGAVKGFSVRGGVSSELLNLSWTPEGIGKPLAAARSSIGRTARLLVGEPFAYVATVLLPESKETYASPHEEREAVLQYAGKLIPEELKGTAWDYREVSIPTSLPGRPVQVVSLVASFARIVAPAIREVGFRIAAILPESCAMASLFVDRKDPFLLVYKGESFFVAGIANGVVLSSVTSIGTVTFPAIESVGRFMNDRFAISPKAIVFAGSFSDQDLADFDRARAEADGFSVEFSEKTAILGMAEDKDFSGDDRSVLSVQLIFPETEVAIPEGGGLNEYAEGDARFRSHALDERTLSERAEREISSPRIPRRTIVLAAMFLVVLLSGGSAVYFIKKNQAGEMKASSNVAPESVESSPTESHSESGDSKEGQSNSVEPTEATVAPAFNRASFRIAVENGSGEAGVAGQLEKTLQAEGFVVVRTGNASSKQMASVVRAKPSVPSAFLDELVSISKLDSSVERRADIPESGEEDGIIVIGRETSFSEGTSKNR